MKPMKGIAIELIIGFMLVVYSFCTLITTTVLCMNKVETNAISGIEDRITVDQVGEYYLRAVENGWTFPSGNETDASAYPEWVRTDDDALAFFQSCKKDGYSFKSLVATKHDNFWHFYRIKGIGHKLLVSKANTATLYILVAENPQEDTYKPKYEVLNWSYADINDGLDYSDREHSLLWRIWYWIGNIFFS